MVQYINNSIVPQITFENINQFRLPKLRKVTPKNVIERQLYRDRLKHSMNITPKIGLKNKPKINKYGSGNDIIIDGVNINLMHQNMRLFDGDLIISPTVRHVLFIDHYRHEYTFWNNFLRYVDSMVPIVGIFLHEFDGIANEMYYRNGNQFDNRIRNHNILDIMLRQILENNVGNRELKYVVIDEISNSLQRLNEVMQLVNSGRLLGIGQMYRILHTTKLKPQIRSNFDYVILNPFHASQLQLNQIYETYFSIFPSFAIFNALVNQLRLRGEFLVFDALHGGHNLYDKIFRLPVEEYLG